MYGGTGGERILIVEDEELMRELLTRILAGENYRIYEASSAEEAMKLMQDRSLRPGADRPPAEGHERLAITDRSAGLMPTPRSWSSS